MTRVLDLVEGINKATLDERVKAHATNAELAKLSLRQASWLRTLGLLVVIAAIIGFSALDKLRPETIAILSTIAGYLLAQNRPPSG